jgi:hypothetical protein
MKVTGIPSINDVAAEDKYRILRNWDEIEVALDIFIIYLFFYFRLTKKDCYLEEYEFSLYNFFLSVMRLNCKKSLSTKKSQV